MLRNTGPRRALIAWAVLTAVLPVVPAWAQPERTIRSYVAYFPTSPDTATVAENCPAPDGAVWRDGTYRIVIRDDAGGPAKPLILGIQIKDGKTSATRDLWILKDGKNDDFATAIATRPAIAAFLVPTREAVRDLTQPFALLTIVCGNGSQTEGNAEWSPLAIQERQQLSEPAGLAALVTAFEIAPAPSSLAGLKAAMETIRNGQKPSDINSILGLTTAEIIGNPRLRTIFLSFPKQTDAPPPPPQQPVAEPPTVKPHNEGGGGGLVDEPEPEPVPEEDNTLLFWVLGVVLAVPLAYLAYRWLTRRQGDVSDHGDEETRDKGWSPIARSADPVRHRPYTTPDPTPSPFPAGPDREAELAYLDAKWRDQVDRLAAKCESLARRMEEKERQFQDDMAHVQQRLAKCENKLERIQPPPASADQSGQKQAAKVMQDKPPPLPVPGDTRFQAGKAGFQSILDDMQCPREYSLALTMAADLGGLLQWLHTYLLASGQSRARYREIADRMRERRMGFDLILPSLNDQLDEYLHEPVEYHARAGRAQQIVELVQPGLIDRADGKVLFKARVHISH